MIYVVNVHNGQNEFQKSTFWRDIGYIYEFCFKWQPNSRFFGVPPWLLLTNLRLRGVLFMWTVWDDKCY